MSGTYYQPLRYSNSNNKQRKSSWIKNILLTTALFFFLWLFTACSYQDETMQKMDDSEKSGSEQSVTQLMEEQWGVRPLSVQLTATDYMLDFRYRVIDPEKAAAIINRKTKPYLIVEKTGVRLDVPSSYKVGPLRQSAQFSKANKNYFMLFANPGRRVKAGEKVTIVAGDFKLEHVTVN